MTSYLSGFTPAQHPTSKQYERFLYHVADAHSWYKHLPLLNGALFVVYPDADAGKNYPTQHPRLPFGNDYDGYKRAFGCLNYAYQTKPGGMFHRDDSTIVIDNKITEKPMPDLPPVIWEQCSFILYPTINDNGFETTFYAQREDFEQIEAGGYHPYRDLLLEWKSKTLEANEYYDDLSEEERDRLFNLLSRDSWYYKDAKIDYTQFSGKAAQYLLYMIDAEKAFVELQSKELRKIKQALENLQQILQNL